MSDPIEPTQVFDAEGHNIPQKSRFSRKNLAIAGAAIATTAAAVFAIVKFRSDDETDEDVETISEPNPFSLDLDVTTPDA